MFMEKVAEGSYWFTVAFRQGELEEAGPNARGEGVSGMSPRLSMLRQVAGSRTVLPYECTAFT
jgi:hypothetical protein